MRLTKLYETINAGQPDDDRYFARTVKLMSQLREAGKRLDNLYRDIKGSGVNTGLNTTAPWSAVLRDVAIQIDQIARPLYKMAKHFPGDDTEESGAHHQIAVAALQKIIDTLQGGINSSDQIDEVLSGCHYALRNLESMINRVTNTDGITS